jgi:hypothetical protein
MRIRSMLGKGTVVVVRLPLEAKITARATDSKTLTERRVA